MIATKKADRDMTGKTTMTQKNTMNADSEIVIISVVSYFLDFFYLVS